MSARKIFYNTFLQSVGKVISSVLGILTVAAMSRYLGKTGFGEYTTVASFMGFFSVLADLGLYLVMTKRLCRPRVDEGQILGNVFVLRFVSAFPILIAGAVIALFFPYSPAVKKGMFLGVLAFSLVSGTQVLSGVFQKYLIVYQFVAAEIAQRGLMFGLVLYFIRQQSGLLSFIVAFTVSSAVLLFLTLRLCLRKVPFRLHWDPAFWKEILTESWPLALSGALSLIYFRADTLILSVLKPADDVGVYGLSRKIVEVLLVFPALFAGLIMPFLSRFAFSDWANYKRYLQRSLDALFLAIVPMVLVAFFFARPIVNVVGGREFANADSVFKIMIVGTGFMYITLLLGYAIVALGLQKAMVWGNLMGSVVGIGLFLLLIPRFSYFGAATGMLVVQVVVCGYAYVLTSHTAGFYPSAGALGKALAAAVPVAAFFKWVTIPWFLQVIAGMGIYLFALLVVGGIPGEFIRELVTVNASPPAGSRKRMPAEH